MPQTGMAAYHHPHFVSAEDRGHGRIYFRFRAFTGNEPEPELPDGCYGDGSGLTWEDRDWLRAEYRSACIVWGQARFHREATPLLVKAAPVWDEYAGARRAMDEIFAAFWDTQDGMWRAQILRLTDAHARALAAAQRWDDTAEQLTDLDYKHLRQVGEGNELELKTVARGIGLDITAWHLAFYDDYRRSSSDWGEFRTPLVAELTRETERHKTRLREVDDVATLPRDT